MKRFFLFLVLVGLGLMVLDYVVDHRHDDDSYLQQLEHTLACSDWVTYDDPTYGYRMRYPSCFVPAEAEGEGSVRLVFVEQLPLRDVQYMTLETGTEVCRDSLNPYREMRRRAKEVDGVCLQCSSTEYLLSARLVSRGPQATAYRLQAKYVLKQRLWFVETLVYPEDFASAVGSLVREVKEWQPFLLACLCSGKF